MAKKKDIEVIEEVIEEVVEEAIEEPTEITDRAVEEEQNDDQFIYTQLKLINSLNNPAKARRLAARVLRNRKR